MRMYSDKDLCLHHVHVFLLDHRIHFGQLLRRMIKEGYFCENETLFSKLQDKKILLTKEEVDQYLLDPYFQDVNFDATNGSHPEKDDTPPEN